MLKGRFANVLLTKWMKKNLPLRFEPETPCMTAQPTPYPPDQAATYFFFFQKIVYRFGHFLSALPDWTNSKNVTFINCYKSVNNFVIVNILLKNFFANFILWPYFRIKESFKWIDFLVNRKATLCNSSTDYRVATL